MKEYLQIRNHEGKNVYYLSVKGRELVGAETEIKWSLQVDHYLLRNDMYLYFHCPGDWRTEEKVTFKYQEGLTYKDAAIVPDATFSQSDVYYFLEVDRTQSMVENQKKITLYQLLSPAIEKQFKNKPILVFYTTTENRRKLLGQYCEEVGLKYKIYTKDDLR